MCGIVGFTAEYLDPASARQTVKAMAELIRHRGPDGEGYYADTRAALGHRRLSIIDVNGGGQPMFNEDGTLVVVFNGELYNYKPLRAELRRLGHTFATDSDTEVLLHGYEAWGAALPRHLRGMFAFALWDRTAGTLFCARDLFGIKPLYYYQKGACLLFASEIKAFLAHPAFEKQLNEARLPDWLSMEYLPDRETLFAGVYELPPAHTLCWQNGRVSLQRYAAPRFRVQRGRSLRSWAQAMLWRTAPPPTALRMWRSGAFSPAGWIPRWSCVRRRATSLRYSAFRSAIGRKNIPSCPPPARQRRRWACP